MLGPSTVCSVLSGKHYSRGVCAHKAAMEALFRTLWRKFEVWLNEHDKEATTCTDFSILLDVLRKGNFKPITFKELLHCPGFMALHKTFYHFCSTLQSSVAKFWLSYLEMVQVLLMYLRSMRMADWKLHLHCLRKILPFGCLLMIMSITFALCLCFGQK